MSRLSTSICLKLRKDKTKMKRKERRNTFDKKDLISTLKIKILNKRLILKITLMYFLS